MTKAMPSSSFEQNKIKLMMKMIPMVRNKITMMTAVAVWQWQWWWQ
jgi:hypothetical protein